jgi:signal transduction histidine kinase
LGRVTGTVAHDFANLLTPIAGNLDLLAQQPDDPRSARRLATARTAVDRAAALVKSLLAVARQQPLTFGSVDANDTIRGMQDLLTGTLAAQGKLKLDLDPDLWRARADKTQLEMAILNLAVNARDAMTHPGLVAVSTANVMVAPGEVDGLTGEFVRVAVQDTGSGMPPDVLARAFEPLFTTKAPGKGTGLGLASIYGFARQCGGAATINSEPGRGTKVTIYLPREKADAGRPPHGIPDSSPTAPSD